MVGVFAEEVDSSIRNQELGTPHVPRAAPPAPIPVALRGAGTVLDLESPRPGTGVKVVDRHTCRGVGIASNVVVPPTTRMVIAVTQNFTDHDRIGRSIGHIGNTQNAADHAGKHPRQIILPPSIAVVCIPRQILRKGIPLIAIAVG